MQKPWNCNIYRERPSAKHRAARAVWDYFVKYGNVGLPVKVWFVRDEFGISAWCMMDANDEPDEEVDSAEAIAILREDRLIAKGLLAPEDRKYAPGKLRDGWAPPPRAKRKPGSSTSTLKSPD